MSHSDGQSKWTDRLIPVPLWYLLAGGGGVIVADNAVDKFISDETANTAQAATVERDEDLRTEMRSIAAKIDEMQAAQARMEGRLTSMERTVGELQQDLKTIKLAIR